MACWHSSGPGRVDQRTFRLAVSPSGNIYFQPDLQNLLCSLGTSFLATARDGRALAGIWNA